jgi:hypothetical protein
MVETRVEVVSLWCSQNTCGAFATHEVIVDGGPEGRYCYQHALIRAQDERERSDTLRRRSHETEGR